MPFLILLTLFIFVPIAEISVLIRVASSIGPLYTIVFVIFTAVLGAHLVRQQGFATLNKLREETNAGRVPALQIAEGVALLFAGAVLLTPGFITDAVGFALLAPPIRLILINWAASKMTNSASGFTYHHTSSTPQRPDIHSDVIEGEYSEPDQNK